MLKHFCNVLAVAVASAFPLAAIDLLWASQLQPRAELVRLGTAAISPWVFSGLLIGLGLFFLEALLRRRVGIEDRPRPLSAIGWCVIGDGGSPIATILVWTLLLVLARFSASALLGLEPGGVAVFLVFFVMILLLLVRCARFAWCERLRHPIVLMPLCLLALALINTDGIYFIPHQLWIFVALLIAGASIAVSSLLPQFVVRVVAAAALLLGIVGWNVRTHDVHFWLNSYDAGQYGAWQITQFATDFDGDGFSSIFGGKDCSPFDSRVHPAAVEFVGNGVDETCAGYDLAAHVPIPELTQPQGTMSPGQKPNLILITVDTLRADAVRSMPRTVTPFLDEVAARGQYFSRAYTPAPHTAEALPAAMTGMYPSDWHQKAAFLGFQPTMAAEFQRLGFSTSAVLSLPFVEPGLLNGFQYIDNSIGERVSKEAAAVTGMEVTELALSRVDEVSEGPFLLWIHYFDPHAPWIAGPYPSGDGAISRYLQEVHRTDLAIGRLFNGLADRGLLNKSALVVFSDHGEALGEHRALTHAWDLWESQIRIPLIFRMPGVPPVNSDVRVSLIDLVPTIYDYYGITGAGERRGVSLMPIMVGKGIEERALFFESNYRPKPYGLARAVILNDKKFIFDMRRSAYGVFDLGSDPAEAHNLVDRDPELFNRLQGELDRWWKETYNDVAIQEKGKAWEARKSK